ncbi:DUF58 domain-containing protein [Gleimia sp. 6138-11-ORH1]|uniref:DUF58 domain-containing protein n=1 Tax=Gleimia sp. 6138-11-ORH1 TaxID=2973937 RepID=UPI002167539A|nr:DUF58 domain-containing protein [Gleimia sp. 6138-11-ORH1]MCS4485083.1 DUF58 domain-containing protein [Gleimia sp. 6138-11-ORH1]
MIISWRTPVLVLLGLPLVVWKPTILTVTSWSLFVALLVLIDVLLAPNLRLLSIRREQPKTVRALQPSASIIELRSPKKMKIQVRDAWQPSAQAGYPNLEKHFGNRHTVQLLPEEPSYVETPLLPARRGKLWADHVTVRSWGPFGLGGRQLSFKTATFLEALPAFPSIKQLPRALAKLQIAEGQALAKQRGQGTEFDSLREWVDGDDVRSIDWRATARHGESIIVRTWRPQRDRHIMMLLDTSRVSAVRLGDVSRLDAQMDAALLLAGVCAKANDNISLVAGSQAVRAKCILPQRNQVLNAMSKTMTELPAEIIEADWNKLAHSLNEFGNKLSLLVIFSPVEPHILEASLLPVLATLRKRTKVLIASVIDPDLTDLTEQRNSKTDLYTAAAAISVRDDHEKALQGLRTAGISIVEGTPQSLPMKVVDHYLLLKSQAEL